MNVTETRHRERYDIEADHAGDARAAHDVAPREASDLYRCENPRDPKSAPYVCPHRAVAGSALFKAEKGDEAAIAIEDVRQWAIGDCSLMAALGAMTRSAEGRAAIRGMIHENRDANGMLMSYTVTFRAGPHKTVDVRISPELPTGAAGVARDGEIWPGIVEKAYAQLRGNYTQLHGLSVARVLADLTGRTPERLAPGGDDAAVKIERAIARGECVVVATKAPTEPPTPLPPGIVSGHAFTVTAMEIDGFGNKTLVLRNPWGGGGSVRVPQEEWPKLFATIVTC